MSHAAINDTFWLVSLLLQLLLVGLLFTRGIHRKLPVLTTLLIFYPLRSILLFALSGHLSPPTFANIYSSLSVVDIILQFLLAIEIAVHLFRHTAARISHRIVVLSFLAVLACIATFFLTRILPPDPPIPPDRVQIYDSFLLLFLSIWVITRNAPALLLRVSLGFGAYAAIDLLATVIRTVAATRHDVPTFEIWSYIRSATYVLVVIFWILALQTEPASASPSATSPEPALAP
jgi:hypothetical protein